MAAESGIDLALASEQKSPPGQQMMSDASPILARARPCASSSRHRSRQIRPRHMRQHQVLLMGDADLAVAEAIGEVGQRIHLVGGRVARRDALTLQADGDRRMIRMTMRGDVARFPGAEAGIGLQARASPARRVRQRRIDEIAPPPAPARLRSACSAHRGGAPNLRPLRARTLPRPSASTRILIRALKMLSRRPMRL